MSLYARILAGAGLLLGLVAAQADESGRLFRVSSESMEPTMRTGDEFVARMTRPESFARGDILLVAAPAGGTYILRIVGLPGDRIELVDGIVILNGRPVAPRFVRWDQVAWARDGMPVRRLAEQFPGEAAAHEIYDDQDSVGDNFPLLTVAPGHLFLLGDNRDHSADSRFPVREYGVGQVPFERVSGWPLPAPPQSGTSEDP